MIYNLQNIIPLGVLDYGIYPNKDRRPIIYLYYRPNGDLMMYRTKDEIEVNLIKVVIFIFLYLLFIIHILYL